MNIVGRIVHITVLYPAFDGKKATYVSGLNSVGTTNSPKVFFPFRKRKDIITSVIYL